MTPSRHGTTKVTVIALVFILLAGAGIAIWYFAGRASRPDFNEVGGTILLYEVEEGDRHNHDIVDLTDPGQILIEMLQRRMESADLRQVTVSGAGKRKVEFRIARTENHEKEIQQVKELLARIGSLEFRILANSRDDEHGIAAATATIERRRNELEDLAKNGQPPPPPTREDDPTNTKLAVFTINLAKGTKSSVTYGWVELSSQELQTLNLDNAIRDDPQRNKTWIQAQKLRDRAGRLLDVTDRPLLQGALFSVRECQDRNLSEEARRRKELEYFVLAREPEMDPKDPTLSTRTPRIDGSYLISAVSDVGSDDRPAIHLGLNNEGRLFRELTRKNVPSGAGAEETVVRRHLAIILDGLVMSAPTINSEISTRAQISGNFTQKEVDNLAAILRSGRLPARLKPQPLSETTVAPADKGNQ